MWHRKNAIDGHITLGCGGVGGGVCVCAGGAVQGAGGPGRAGYSRESMLNKTVLCGRAGCVRRGHACGGQEARFREGGIFSFCCYMLACSRLHGPHGARSSVCRSARGGAWAGLCTPACACRMCHIVSLRSCSHTRSQNAKATALFCWNLLTSTVTWSA